MQDSLAVEVPDEVFATNAVAERFTLEFWRGTMYVGECSLPILRVRESIAEQVCSKCCLFANAHSPHTLQQLHTHAWYSCTSVVQERTQESKAGEVRQTSLRPDLPRLHAAAQGMLPMCSAADTGLRTLPCYHPGRVSLLALKSRGAFGQ